MLRSMTGLIVTLVRESAHQDLELVEQQEPLAFLEPSGGTEDRLLPSVGGAGVEVGVEHDLPRGGEPVGVVLGRS